MKRVSFAVLVLLIAGFAFQGTGFAKLVSGKVAAVDETTSKLSVTTTDAAGAEQTADIWVKSDATLSGVKALNELKAGDEVWVEAEEEEGNWKASKITKA